jgi:hypothetical protein
MAPLPLKTLIRVKNARVLECLQPLGAREFASTMSALENNLLTSNLNKPSVCVCVQTNILNAEFK